MIRIGLSLFPVRLLTINPNNDTFSLSLSLSLSRFLCVFRVSSQPERHFSFPPFCFPAFIISYSYSTIPLSSSNPTLPLSSLFLFLLRLSPAPFFFIFFFNTSASILHISRMAWALCHRRRSPLPPPPSPPSFGDRWSLVIASGEISFFVRFWTLLLRKTPQISIHPFEMSDMSKICQKKATNCGTKAPDAPGKRNTSLLTVKDAGTNAIRSLVNRKPPMSSQYLPAQTFAVSATVLP